MIEHIIDERTQADLSKLYAACGAYIFVFSTISLLSNTLGIPWDLLLFSLFVIAHNILALYGIFYVLIRGLFQWATH